jgi:rhomboid protease GluP
MGPLTEKLLGNTRFAVLYVCAGLAGSVASLLWNPLVNSAGASGAIFGVMGGLLAIMLNPRSRIPFSVARVHRRSAGVFIAYNVFYGFAHAGIDNAAHIGGLLSGFAMGWFFARPLRQGEDDRVVPGGTSAAAIAIMVVLSLPAWLLFHPTAERAMQREFRFGFADFVRVEDVALAREQELLSDVKGKRITDVQWGILTRDGVLPLWMNVQDQVEVLPDPTEPTLKSLRKSLVEYAHLRYLSAELHSEAAITSDAAKAEWANATDARLSAQLTEASALIKAAF